MLAAILQTLYEPEFCEKTKSHAGPGEVILKVETNTPCGTDYRLFTGTKTAGVRYEVAPSHEFAGRVMDIDEGVDTTQSGLILDQ